MLDIIILVFLVIRVGNKAERKGQPVLRWRILTVAAWFAGELLGLLLGFALFGFSMQSLPTLMLIAIMGAFGGFLLVKYNLDKYPDLTDINE